MEKCLVLSDNSTHGLQAPYFLARKMEKYGVPTLLTNITWPRDDLLFLPSGQYVYCQGGTSQCDLINHFAYHGGSFLRGNDFIISSLAGRNNPSKREMTHQILGVSRGYYYDVGGLVASLGDISVSGNDRFFSHGPEHIDVIANISNHVRHLFVYNTPLLQSWGAELAQLTGYTCTPIPLEEAKYAGIGFEIIGHVAIVDRRARKTASILDSLGHTVVMTPSPMRPTNRANGSIHCITNQIPIAVCEILTTSYPPISAGIDLRLPDGNVVLTNPGRIKIKS